MLPAGVHRGNRREHRRMGHRRPAPPNPAGARDLFASVKAGNRESALDCPLPQSSRRRGCCAVSVPCTGPYRKAATTTPSSAAAPSGSTTRQEAPTSPATPASARSTGTGPITLLCAPASRTVARPLPPS